MLNPEAPKENIFAQNNSNENQGQLEYLENEGRFIEVGWFSGLKKAVDSNVEAAIVCETKENNPHYLSIIHANKKFYEIFGISEHNLVGKSYDFLFNDLDLNYTSEDQIEYIRLIKDVKDFRPCTVIITLSDQKLEASRIKFKITFAPWNFAHKKSYYAIFTFEKIEVVSKEESRKISSNSGNSSLLKNLERTLRNERLLRKVGSFIISDMPIHSIAQNVAQSLCEHLKADRCLLHDYKNGKSTFVAEYCSGDSKALLSDKNDSKAIEMLTDYINFQMRFYESFGSSGKSNLLTIANDIISDNNFSAIKPICEKFMIASQIAVTTTFNSKVNGGIYIHQSDKRNWTADELELIEMIADQFSIAVDRSESIEKVMLANHALMEKTVQLKEALKEEKKIRKMQNEFVALVSHEFKTPLQIIDSTRELLTRKLKTHNINDEGLDKFLDRIKSGIQRMNGLIHSTLNLARMETASDTIKVEKQKFDLKKFVLEIVEKNSNLALNRNISLVTKLDELPTEFNGDSKLLEHSFTNIISNAIKYSKTNGKVKIFAKVANGKVAIRVIDQGIGIPKDDLSNIGKKFFRAKNTLAVAGTGIGLYLTKHFIELHGGSVVIESEIDVGTSVTVILPIS